MRRSDAAPALAAVAAAALPLAYLRGFTADDALIPARYAAHLASGLGYRFNAHGPVSDGVTPLGFAHLLAPFARSGPLAAFAAARLLGVVAWLSAAAALGVAIARASERPARFLALALVATSAPLAAWSVAGLETGLATALATAAVVIPAGPRASLVGAFAAGLVAWLRPEALPFALVLGLARGRELDVGVRRRLVAYARPVLLAALPFAVVVAVRLVVFGRPAPLALLAKPSDLAHGATYALACALLTGGPLAVLAPFAWQRLPSWPRACILAASAHFAAVAVAGGDWMPLSRLVVPALPALVFAAAHVLSVSRLDVGALRIAIAVAGEVWTFARVGPAASRVLADRMALVEAARGVLAGKRVVAAVDVGWVGAATDAEVVDLAGVTDLAIAALPGGHTSKAVTGAMLAERGVEALVVQRAAGGGFARRVEGELMREGAVRERFERVWGGPDGIAVRYEVWGRAVQPRGPSGTRVRE